MEIKAIVFIRMLAVLKPKELRDMKTKAILLIMCMLSFQLKSQTNNVPSDYSSIQEAINNSNNGDTVLVDTGIYLENLVLNNKNIVLCSRYIESNDEYFTENTIIDGNNEGSVIEIFEGEIDTNTCIIGFSIVNGSGKKIYFEQNGEIWDSVYYGGGIYVGDSCFPVLKNLIIANNTADYGGGIAIKGGTSRIENIVVRNNSSSKMGGGIYFGAYYKGLDILNSCITQNISKRGGGIDYMSGFNEKRLFIKDTEISNNTATYAGIYGYESGGALHGGNTHVILENVTIVNNEGLTDFCLANYFLEIRNSIIWNNEISLFTQHGDSITTHIEYTDIENGQNNLIISGYNTLSWGEGNIDILPDFVDPDISNYKLNSSSPCIDAGNPSPLYNDSDGSRNDMGAHEYVENVGLISNNQNEIKVYPNPSSDFIFIETDCNRSMSIELINCTGQIMMTENVADKKQLDISMLKAGIYILKIKSNNRILGINKIVKQ